MNEWVSNLYQSMGLNSSLPTPHRGQTQSSGMSSKAVPGAIPPSGSPTSGSYTQFIMMMMDRCGKYITFLDKFQIILCK